MAVLPPEHSERSGGRSEFASADNQQVVSDSLRECGLALNIIAGALPSCEFEWPRPSTKPPAGGPQRRRRDSRVLTYLQPPEQSVTFEGHIRGPHCVEISPRTQVRRGLSFAACSSWRSGCDVVSSSGDSDAGHLEYLVAADRFSYCRDPQSRSRICGAPDRTAGPGRRGPGLSAGARDADSALALIRADPAPSGPALVL